jgi:hypothetical protein
MPNQWVMPQATKRPWGLLTDAATALPASAFSENFPGGPGPNRMQQGVTFTPWGCGGLRWGDSEACQEPVRMVLQDGDEGDPGYSPGYFELQRTFPETRFQKAFRFADALGCSTLSSDWEMLERRTHGRMDLMASEALALQLNRGWATTPVVGGDLAGEGDHSLQSDAVVNGSTLSAPTTSIENSMIVLEEWLADALHGGKGLIHVSPGILSNVMGQLGGKVIDGHVVAASGHEIVADAGYAHMWGPGGTIPAADRRWIYASGPVWYQVAAEKDFRDESNVPTVNALLAIREAFGILLYDPCTVAAVLVDLAP